MDIISNILTQTDRRMRELLLQFARGNSGISLGNSMRRWVGIGGEPTYIFPGAAASVGHNLYAAAYDHTHPVYDTPNWASDVYWTYGHAGTSEMYFALYDHAHRGVRTLYASPYAPLFGDIVLSAGSNVTLSQSGNVIQISASDGGGGGASSELAPIDASAAASVGAGDAFDGTTLDGGWSDLQSTAVTSKVRSADGWLVLKNTGNTSGQERGVQRAFSPSGDFTVSTRIDHATLFAAYQWAGLFAGAADPSDGGAGNRVQTHIYNNGSGWRWKFAKMAAGSDNVVFDVAITDVGDFSLYDSKGQYPFWLRITRVGSTISASLSWDGVEWYDHPTTTTIAFSVSTCGLYIGESSASHNIRGSFPYIATTG